MNYSGPQNRPGQTCSAGKKQPVQQIALSRQVKFRILREDFNRRVNHRHLVHPSRA